MRALVLVALSVKCQSGPPPPAVQGPPVPRAPRLAAPCTIASDTDLFEFLRAHDCAAPTDDTAPADVDVQLVRGGTEYYDSISFRVVFENRRTAPVAVDFALRDQRLCFDLDGGGVPSHACALLETAPAGVASRARVILQPHVTARVDGLVFIRHTQYEQQMQNGANGWFDEPLPPGEYPVIVRVPLARDVVLRTNVTVP